MKNNPKHEFFQIYPELKQYWEAQLNRPLPDEKYVHFLQPLAEIALLADRISDIIRGYSLSKHQYESINTLYLSLDRLRIDIFDEFLGWTESLKEPMERVLDDLREMRESSSEGQ